MDRHLSCPFVKEATRLGYRSRASLKLKSIDEQYRCFKRGMNVVDLGAAPGGWSQYLSQVIGESGSVVALDLLPMAFIPGVTFMQGDFMDPLAIEALRKSIPGKVDWVVSDMAPNFSGLPAVDIPRSYNLADNALEFAHQVLNNKGSFLIKVFQGAGFEAYVKSLKACFKTVRCVKPKASRDSSRELYLLATDYNVYNEANRCLDRD